ncbi:MAG TPA: hypothetical protein DHU96_31330 [Actinobacteria bacterium]|nr:hypothetical protein [Actinomycetota bacterium]
MRLHGKFDSTRSGRWLRGFRPDHNPLRRASDRAESAILALLLGAFLIGAPLLAVAAGQWAANAGHRLENAQRAGRYQVTAVLTANAPNQTQNAYGTVMGVEVRARWTAPGGITRTGLVTAPPGEKAGSLVWVWVDRAGNVTSSPEQASDLSGQRALATLLAPVALGLALLAMWSLAHRILDKRRMAAWDADWAATGPRWTSRR